MDAALITTTRYNSSTEIRYQIALQTVKSAIRNHIPVYIVDTSEDDNYASSFSSLGATVNRLQKLDTSLPMQRITVMNMAITAGRDCLVFTEPEKTDIVDYFNQITQPISQGKSNLIIPARTSRSWESYPSQMRRTEHFGLEMIKEFCTKPYDLLFGPWAADKSVFHYFLNCNDSGYSWAHTARLEIIKEMAGKVQEVEVDFIYPLGQKQQEEAAGLREYGRRLMQLPDLFFSLDKVYNRV